MRSQPSGLKGTFTKIFICLILISGIKLSILVGDLVAPYMEHFYSSKAKNSKGPSTTTHIIHTIQEAEKHMVPFGAKKVEAAEPASPSTSLLPSSKDELLAKQWQKLKEKQAQLKRKERMLKELEQRIEEKLKEQRALAQRLQRLIDEAEVLKNKKIKHLVEVYSNMEPARAAKVLEKLDKDLAVKILAGMQGRIAGEILNNMDSKTAAKLSEALTRFQTPFGK